MSILLEIFIGIATANVLLLLVLIFARWNDISVDQTRPTGWRADRHNRRWEDAP